LCCRRGQKYSDKSRDSQHQQGNVAYNVVLDIALRLGIVICGYTICKSVHPLPPSPMKYGPWIALIWLAIGVAIVAWRNHTP
jgi:hypothetical protein